uniref:Uncharacterized protein n=1 Tax=Siphoviridae sp. ctWf32 TaxID=2827884 RepID=A0A8S5SV51_9CAUD|nr:MAG TPA: hypothetical protein [Siphoviridae sp. ctWf32]
MVRPLRPLERVPLRLLVGMVLLRRQVSVPKRLG